jgi:Uma2 family endonuclease
MSAIPRPSYTEEEYLLLERTAVYKSEYFRGEIFAMAGASDEHNTIAGNIREALGPHLRDRNCRRYILDMRLKVVATGLYTYPDVMVVCGERQFTGDRPDTVTNPQVIFEVLSESTEKYDRDKKFSHYQRIPTLQEYVLVAQDKPLVDHYKRDDGNRWTFHRYEVLTDQVEFSSISATLQLTEIYEAIDFTDEAI